MMSNWFTETGAHIELCGLDSKQQPQSDGIIRKY